tara:strand:+ start:327 stop:527 length:201 start_codon:yes stop_codon:yes gene_type:complete
MIVNKKELVMELTNEERIVQLKTLLKYNQTEVKRLYKVIEEKDNLINKMNVFIRNVNNGEDNATTI